MLGILADCLFSFMTVFMCTRLHTFSGLVLHNHKLQFVSNMIISPLVSVGNISVPVGIISHILHNVSKSCLLVLALLLITSQFCCIFSVSSL